jgi:hypothetical protein
VIKEGQDEIVHCCDKCMRVYKGPDGTMKQHNINARHLGLILRFPMTSILYNGKQLALLLLLAC